MLLSCVLSLSLFDIMSVINVVVGDCDCAGRLVENMVFYVECSG